MALLRVGTQARPPPRKFDIYAQRPRRNPTVGRFKFERISEGKEFYTGFLRLNVISTFRFSAGNDLCELFRANLKCDMRKRVMTCSILVLPSPFI